MMRVVFICVTLAVLSPRYAEAVERMWRVGVLTPVDDGIVRSVMLPYLATRGFVEGRNLVVDFRIGTAEQLPELAQALVGDKPDAIIARSDWALYPARAATSTIPIVAAPIGVDPVRARIAESWAHPGGDVTGVQRRPSGRVTVSRPTHLRLCYQHENRQSAWPHDPAVSPRGRR